MKRLVPLLLLLVPLAALTGHSAAQTTDFGACSVTPQTTYIPCTPVSIVSTIQPNKRLDVTGATPGPFHTVSYGITLTSQLACFTLNEPITLRTLGSPDAAALTPLFPAANGSSPAWAEINVDPDTGTALLALEVWRDVVGPEGVTLKASWPVEGLEQFRVIVPPATPAVPIATATSVATAPAVTSTPPATAPAVTPTASPVPSPTATSAPLSITACILPRSLRGISLGGEDATLYAQTTAGAQCHAGVFYNTGEDAASFPTDLTETANSQGLVYWSWHEDTLGTQGTAVVSCTLGDQNAATLINFPISQADSTQGQGILPSRDL